MLMVVCIDIGSYQRAVWAGLAVARDIGLQGSRKSDLELDAGVLEKIIIPNVLCKYMSE
jgi:hypothetical protein